ncbi:MAG: phosphatidate cytidylyltransferase [Peptococcaceae bacterium]|jgi:phosphatidate cytidylyltransferase|nr:phosphatidate cytidylyltransferase [Peptococcaceae bacterium]
MAKRILSALIGIPLLLCVTYLGGIYIAILVAVMALLLLREFFLLEQKMKLRGWPVLTALAALGWLVLLFFQGETMMLPGLFLWFAVAFGRLALSYPHCQLRDALSNFFALLYTVVLPSHFLLLRQIPEYGMAWALLLLILIWATDSLAFLTGRLLGKHPLAPRISPHKTIEGCIGGLAGSILIGFLGWRWLQIGSWPFFIGLGLLVGVSAQIGDLLESSLKRIAGVKDSGNLIPGHGGVLDRFDSLVFAVPLVYYYITLLWV